MAQVVDKVAVQGVDVPIVFEKDTKLPISSLQLVIKNSGSAKDGELFGIARFVSNMLSEGSKEMGAIAFAKALEQRAINLSVHAGTETFVFEISSLKEQFPYALEMLTKLLKNPNFTQETFEKIKLLTLGMLSNKQSDYDYIASVNLNKLIFENTPFGHPYNGDLQSIEKITLDDVMAFYAKNVSLENAIIVAGGDMSLDDIKELLEPTLSKLSHGQSNTLEYAEANKNEKEMVVDKPSEQAYIYFGAPFHMQSNDEESYKAKVASFILGESGFGSRLMEEIRVKRGLAYSAYSRVSINKSHSSFTGHLQTKNESLSEAKKIVKKEIERFIQKGVTKEELAQAKRFLLGSEPLRNETLSQRLSRAFFEYYRGFELGYSKKQLEKIEALKLEDLNAFIKKHDEISKLSFSVVAKSSETK
ncbi:MAG: pitrilysin family protein [Sulfurospirillaceae bacterium]|nr:pitrilysin family protein [Sulfurospirillaceae bacterium]